MCLEVAEVGMEPSGNQSNLPVTATPAERFLANSTYPILQISFGEEYLSANGQKCVQEHKNLIAAMACLPLLRLEYSLQTKCLYLLHLCQVLGSRFPSSS